MLRPARNLNFEFSFSPAMSEPTLNVTPRPVVRPCVSVVMPIYNEAATVAEIIGVVLSQPCVAELIIVDDASTDGTWDAIKAVKADSRVKTFRHEVNQGKGAALRTGISRATADLVVIQDADLEYDPGEYPLLIEPILLNRADVVYGSRFLGAGSHRVLYYWHSLGNRFLTTVSNMATNLNLSDMETCYKLSAAKSSRPFPSRKIGSALSPRSRPRLPAPESASTKFPFPIMAALTPRAKRSIGATASGRLFAS